MVQIDVTNMKLMNISWFRPFSVSHLVLFTGLQIDVQDTS
jgi:hypothetical protein